MWLEVNKAAPICEAAKFSCIQRILLTAFLHAPNTVMNGFRRSFTLLLGLLLFITGCEPSKEAPQENGTKMDNLRNDLYAFVTEQQDVLTGISVWDLATDEQFEINGDSLMHAASTMKVPVMIEVFRQAHLGTISMTDSLEVRNSFRSIVDGSAFSIEDDSDDEIYALLGKKMSIRDLVFNAIIVSSNLATNLLIDEFVADSIQSTIERLGVRRMKVLRGVEDLKAYELGMSNQATAADLTLLMGKIAEGQAVSPEADKEMVDILKQQRFNSMIPAGLPNTAVVAHKTGWITAHHHDTAIVYPQDGEPYVLTIMTRGFDDEKESAAYGAEISRRVYAALRSGS